MKCNLLIVNIYALRTEVLPNRLAIGTEERKGLESRIEQRRG